MPERKSKLSYSTALNIRSNPELYTLLIKQAEYRLKERKITTEAELEFWNEVDEYLEDIGRSRYDQMSARLFELLCKAREVIKNKATKSNNTVIKEK